jgi:hypothetical protein
MGYTGAHANDRTALGARLAAAVRLDEREPRVVRRARRDAVLAPKGLGLPAQLGRLLRLGARPLLRLLRRPPPPPLVLELDAQRRHRRRQLDITGL